ncbi:MAG: bifunctional demethylmenaquinone methyltransferase/2-methoxy-6-polyprenyl-1,4-benzoquinol methylase UbiE [Oligoflexales bacterium]|nr:bifunctional demethylmenaquinone methyltransferase/2-methoxy-6-polyprenyl-1,4-benzoquinol methylase UbiE [Oligoflexales bacterium]
MVTSTQEAPPADKEGQIASMFDRIAFRYDFLNSLLSLRQDRLWRKTLVSWIPIKKKGKVLDVACGTGDVLLAAARKLAPYDQHFVGVDISAAMLKLALDKLTTLLATHKELSAERFSFSKMSAEKLGFPDSSFSVLSISFGLRNVVDKEKALLEFARVLEPRGRLLILEFFPARKTRLNRIFQSYFAKILPLIGGLFSDREAYEYLPRSVGDFLSEEQLGKLLAKSGFTFQKRKSFLFGSCLLLQFERV